MAEAGGPGAEAGGPAAKPTAGVEVLMHMAAVLFKLHKYEEQPRQRHDHQNMLIRLLTCHCMRQVRGVGDVHP